MTGSRTILQVGTHATLHPTHGGQLRSHHIGHALEEAGYVVRGIATCWRQDHDIANEREAILDLRTAQRWKGNVAFGAFIDYFYCVTVEEDHRLRAEFFRLAEVARADAVMLEHPWMWPLVRLIPQVALGHAPVIYNSQNVEADLKQRIVQDLSGVDTNATALAQAKELLPAVEALEREVVNKADAVTTCTVEDAKVFETWGAQRTVVAGNGSSMRPTTGLRRPFPSVLPRDCRYAFMVGSGHPPNVSGFEKLVLPWLSLLLPGQRVVIAGEVSDLLRSRLANNGLSAALEGRLILLGRISDLALSALIENAACIILPIEYGGGSSIKTAEALLTNRCIVASPAAMRGFSEYSNLPAVTVADGPDVFGAAVRTLLEDGSMTTLREPSSLAPPTWDVTLAPLVDVINDLLNVPKPRHHGAVIGPLLRQYKR